MQQELGITSICYTWSRRGSDRCVRWIVVMSDAKIQQIGTPEDIYNEPVTWFVADFTGEINMVTATMIEDIK